MQDLSGKRFNRLKILNFHEITNTRKYIWKCQCDCGKIVFYRGDLIKSGRRKSCGCIKSPNDDEYLENLKKRILKNIKIDSNQCWTWTGRIGFGGYGLIKIRRGDNTGYGTHASRAAWIAWKGNIPQNIHVCHHCDNRKCVNPDHLFIGTHHDNMNDMVSKNRQHKRPGEIHPVALFQDQDIYEIRRLWDEGLETQSGLSRKFGASLACIHNIVRRKTWKHLL